MRNQHHTSMKSVVIALSLTLSSLYSLAQESPEYYQEGNSKKVECTCPYERKTTFLGDFWRYGVVGTARSLWTGIVKPTAISSAAGAVQSTYSGEPAVAIVAGAATGVAISKAHRSRNRVSNRKNVNTEPACTCNPCAYHGVRSFAPRHQQ